MEVAFVSFELVPGNTLAALARNTVKHRKATENSDDSNTAQKSPDQLKEVFATLVNVLKEQGLTPQELMDIYQGPEAQIDKKSVPIEIFATKLSPSESLCKYLKENLSLSYKQISRILNRDERSIWTSHHRANEKMSESFSSQLKTSYMIPISIFANRRMSILENLVFYLKEKDELTSYKVAKILNKTPSMIYTIYNRAKSKVQAEVTRQISERPVPTRPVPPRAGPVRKAKKKPVKRKRLRFSDYLK